jgi:Protein of unknown function (DUF3617)
MLRFLVFLVGFLTPAPLALALDMPARAPGLWEMELTADLGDPPQRRRETGRRCIDATVDQLFWRQDLGEGPSARNLCRTDVSSSSNRTITADVVCGGTRETSHVVIRGDFKSAYTMEITEPQGRDHVTIAHKHIGPCEADQRPGDFITGNGTKVHLFGDPKPPDRP